MGTKKEIQKNLNTRKRSQEGEKSQSSSNFLDPKRRRLMMDNSEWIPHDQALLTLFGNVRHGDDTSLGKTYNVVFYRSVAERLSGSEGIDIGDKDVASRLRILKQVFHGNPAPLEKDYEEVGLESGEGDDEEEEEY
ncbi:hypothetical protein CTI12_AA375900 [Artemisia annua]|uniref:Uncharacterized protein n=1 Tax=Artemisia annua TaxID=35608 RepID=A0A2U1MIF0_ARTAN|nr:hypothetical protein CTI12_AA375900 [Artemisia annua]